MGSGESSTLSMRVTQSRSVKIETAMTGQSPGLAGRRRTSRYWCLLARHTMSRWVSPMNCFKRNEMRHLRAKRRPRPNDTTNPDRSGLDVLSDIEKFAAFMRFLAPPVPSTDEPGGAPSINNGKQRFHQVGCTACHTPTLRTGHSTVAALDNKDVNLYSDLAIHDMGTGLADGISQGQAKGREFRSAPLWGLGQRLFFLHDGRTKDLVQAIEQHRSPGSEANGVVRQFFRLRAKDQQDLLNFLRSL